MFQRLVTLGVVGALLSLGALPAAHPALADEYVGVIRVTVFADTNENGLRDSDEPVLGGIPVELVGGESTLRVTAGDDGTFDVKVAAGLWQVSVLAPDGYGVVNDSTREVIIAADGITEAVIDFALKPPVVAVQTPEVTPDSGVAGAVAELPAQPAILPESGARMAPLTLSLAFLLGLLFVGVASVAFGRWMMRRQ